MKSEYNVFARQQEITIAGNTIVVFLDENAWEARAMLNGFEIASARKTGYDVNVWFSVAMPKAIEKEVENALFDSFPVWNGRKFRRVHSKEGSYRAFLWHLKLLSWREAFDDMAEEEPMEAELPDYAVIGGATNVAMRCPCATTNALINS